MKLLSAIAAFAFAITLTTTAQADQQQAPGGVISWFEIPVTDMNRAVAFYNKVLGLNMTVAAHTPAPMAFFPVNGNQVTGALIQLDQMKPGADGAIIYFNGGNDLQPMLDRVEPSGGKVLVKKTLINPQVGYFALFLDTEGNRLGLFSAK